MTSSGSTALLSFSFFAILLFLPAFPIGAVFSRSDPFYLSGSSDIFFSLQNGNPMLQFGYPILSFLYPRFISNFLCLKDRLVFLIKVFYLLPNRCRLDAVESLLKPHLLDVLCYIFQCPGRHTSSLSLRLFLSSFALGSLLRFPLPSPAPS